MSIRENPDGTFTIDPRDKADVAARVALFAYGQTLDETKGDAVLARRLKDIAGRMGAPPEKFAMWPVMFREDDTRHAVATMLFFPPTALRDGNRVAIEAAVFGSANNIIRGIVDEIWRAYTSEPIDPVAAQSIGEEALRVADASRKRRAGQ